jgi:hypothetical protein
MQNRSRCPLPSLPLTRSTLAQWTILQEPPRWNCCQCSCVRQGVNRSCRLHCCQLDGRSLWLGARHQLPPESTGVHVHPTPTGGQIARHSSVGRTRYTMCAATWITKCPSCRGLMSSLACVLLQLHVRLYSWLVLYTRRHGQLLQQAHAKWSKHMRTCVCRCPASCCRYSQRLAVCAEVQLQQHLLRCRRRSPRSARRLRHRQQQLGSSDLAPTPARGCKPGLSTSCCHSVSSGMLLCVAVIFALASSSS